MIIQKAIQSWREGGFNGLLKRMKGYLARRLAKKHTATTVTHQEAMKWFEHRRDEYDRLITAVRPYIRSDSIILDIGANIGYFTFLLTKQLNFRGSVYLFEPVTHLAELCKITFRDAPFNVTVFDFGLSDREAEEDIFIASNGNLGWNTLVAQKATPDMIKLRVRLRPFDTCGINVTPSFIKIDVEGAEYRVIRGMLESLRKWHPLPVILCEVGWGRSHPAWEEEISVFMEMKKIGYALYDLNGIPVEENRLQGTTDVLFIPRKT